MLDLKKVVIPLLILTVIGAPFVFREKSANISTVSGEDTLTIITAHNEALRREYTIAFGKWYKEKTGRDVTIDWRYQGGGRDAARYIESMYANSFRLFWINELKKEWNSAIASAFAARSEKFLKLKNGLESEVTEAFFNSNVGCGADILFGGGVYEFEDQTAKGNFISNDLLETNPEMFHDGAIPKFLSGNRLWDDQGRWFGAALSAFGLIYNEEAIREEGLPFFPQTWMDMGRPELFKKLAIVDPTKSSSTHKAFVMLIQQQMQLAYNQLKNDLSVTTLTKEDGDRAIAAGWTNALCLIQKIIANGRYFTESATRPVVDVSAGNCLAGIAVDFYGFSEAKHLEERSGSKRFKFVMPCGGGAPSADPIGIFRGASQPLLAKEFIKFVLSLEGQKILDFQLNTPGGPQKTTTRRVPILKTIYDSQYEQYRCDPAVRPYEASASFMNHNEWTDDILKAIAFIIKVAFIDLNTELSSAMCAIIQAQNDGRQKNATKAYNVLSDFSDLTIDKIRSEINSVLNGKDIIKLVALQNKLSEKYRKQYLSARKIASVL